MIQDEDIGELDMPAAALGKPGADEFGLMARRIFHNDVDVEIGRNVPLDFIKELAELPRAVAQIYWLALCPLQWDGKCISPVPSVSIL